MNTERAILKGQLADLKNKKISLAVGIDANIRACKAILALSSVSEIAELDLDGAAIHITEARDTKARYMDVCARIHKIKKELE